MWALVAEVVQVNLSEKGQGNVVPSDPEEELAVPEERMELAGSVMN